ncbi:MAG: DUF4838 domain-containing protein [Oscillospiraceae bacterium]|nr:DUF4838 domain-containing protein [Oscillospiraceae bacterium]
MKLTSQSSLTVVIPEKATSRELFAAQELEKYLKIIFKGISVSIVTDSNDVSGDRIIIGGPERNIKTAEYISEADFDAVVPGPEGMYIRAFDDDVIICAGSSKHVNECERGTVYAVYELLERSLGCSFSAYVNPDIAGGEYIPQHDEVDLDGIEYIKAMADNTYRTAIAEYHGRKIENVLNRSFIDWLAKNRYNRILTWMKVYERYKEEGLIEEIERRGIRLTVGHHDAIPMFLPQRGNEYFPEHYYETHPEYYKLTEEGTRFEVTDHFGSWILCSRNPDVVRVIADNIVSWIEKNPTVDTIALWPLDGRQPLCTCPECSKYSDIENYVYAQNAIAKIIGEKHPEIKIDMLAYSNLFDCPDNLELEPNLFIDEALTSATLRLRTIGKPDGSCITETPYEDNLLKWKKAGATVVYYDYLMGTHSCRQRYIPAADEQQSNWKRCMEVGIAGYGTQIEYFNFWNHIFNFYTFARTGYDASLSMEDNLSSFVKMFGEGASYIVEIIRMAEACLDGQVKIDKAGLYLMDNIDKEKAYNLLDKAFDAATTSAARNNIRMMRMGFRYSDVECVYTLLGRDDFFRYVPYEECEDPDGELYYMSHNFDSSRWNDPGFGIMLPLDCKKQAEFAPDHWYEFEGK